MPIIQNYKQWNIMQPKNCFLVIEGNEKILMFKEKKTKTMHVPLL